MAGQAWRGHWQRKG